MSSGKAGRNYANLDKVAAKRVTNVGFGVDYIGYLGIGLTRACLGLLGLSPLKMDMKL